MDHKISQVIFKKAIIILAVLFLFIPFFSLKAEEGESVVVATVNIYDPKIIEQKNNIFKLSFDLSNRVNVQPEVKYAVSLIKQEEGGQSIIDEKIYPETVSLGENQTLPKEITYEAPAYLNGTFQLWLFAQNTSGMMLSLSSLGEVKLNGDSQFLEINSASCYLKVAGEADDKKYILRQGVDIKSDEKLIASCEIINHYDREITFTPEFKTYWRNTFGRLVEDNQESQIITSLKSQEKKEISFVLPKALEPQAYDAVLTLLEGDKIVSNSIAFHYVLRGPSATIQSIRLDKDYYPKGETAKLSFFWTAAADAFPSSRLGATESGILTVQINVTDRDGRACMDTISKELTNDTIEENLDLLITADCVSPQVSATIKDDSGQILDQKLYSIESQNIPPVASESQPKQSGFYIIIAIILIIISLIVFFMKKKSAVMILLFFLVGLGIFLSGGVAEATTFISGDYTYAITLNKATYAPGETITVTVVAKYVGCGNEIYTPDPIYVVINGVRKSFSSGIVLCGEYFGPCPGTWVATNTYTAPSTPASYVATAERYVRVCTGGYDCGDGNCCSWSLLYQSIGTISYNVCAAATSCTSAANACGQTNTGTILCNGTCSATTPGITYAPGAYSGTPGAYNEGYRINTGSGSWNTIINSLGICKIITNNSSFNIFIPTKTSSEWTYFLESRPTNVDVGN